MSSVDSSAAESAQRTAIATSLGTNRFEWLAEGWFRPDALSLPPGANVFPFYFIDSNSSLAVAARIRSTSGTLKAGITVKNTVAGVPAGDITGDDSAAVITTGAWRKWTFRMLRVFTRETTAILSLDGAEVLRFNWDSTGFEPSTLRAGSGHGSRGVTATMSSDEIVLTEKLP